MREAFLRAGVGCRKVRFLTREEAAEAILGLVEQGRDTDPSRPFNVWRCPRCRGWHIGHGWRRDVTVAELEVWHLWREELTHMTTDHAQLREAIKAMPSDRRVVIIGGKSGAYAPWVSRLAHQVESTESGGRWEATFTLPSWTGVVLLTKFISIALSREIVRQAKAAGLPVFGVYNSPGAINRALAFAFDKGPASVEEDSPEEESEMATKTANPAQAFDPITQQPAPDETEVRRVFEEAAAALDLARDTALAALRGARQAVDDAAKLRRLAALLKEVGVGE